MDDRLPTKIWLDAHLRQLSVQGQVFTVLHKGHEAQGSVVLQIFLGKEAGYRILSQATQSDGSSGWLAAFSGQAVTEERARDYVARLMSQDPDVWVIELESATGEHPFPGKLLE